MEKKKKRNEAGLQMGQGLGMEVGLDQGWG